MTNPQQSPSPASTLTSGKPFVTLPTHDALRFKLDRAWEKGLGMMVTGGFGVGKTYGVEQLLNEIQAGRRINTSVSGVPRDRWTSHMVQKDTSSKAVVFGLYAELSRTTSGMNSAKSLTVPQISQRVVEHLVRQRVRVLVLDEVQDLNAEQLNTLLHLPDKVPDGCEKFGLVLIGNANLESLVRQTGQMGQRVAMHHPMLPLRPADIDVVLPQLAPVFEPFRQQKKWKSDDGTAKTWDALCKQVMAHCDGGWRPLRDFSDSVVTFVANGKSVDAAVDAAFKLLISPAGK